MLEYQEASWLTGVPGTAVAVASLGALQEMSNRDAQTIPIRRIAKRNMSRSIDKFGGKIKAAVALPE
jgi:hypothetical protein